MKPFAGKLLLIFVVFSELFRWLPDGYFFVFLLGFLGIQFKGLVLRRRELYMLIGIVVIFLIDIVRNGMSARPVVGATYFLFPLAGILFGRLLGHGMLQIWRYFTVLMLIAVFLVFVSVALNGILVVDVDSSLALLRGQKLFFNSAVDFTTAIELAYIITAFIPLFSSRWQSLFRFFFVVALILTFSRKSLILIAFGEALLANLKYSKGLFIIFFVMLGLLVAPFAGDVFSRFDELRYYLPSSSVSDNTARTAMLLVSLELGLNFFPFGAGLGLFGSVAAKTWYSPIYKLYGLDTVYGLEPNSLELGRSFLVDTFLPSILGELGFVFGLIYILWLIKYILGVEDFNIKLLAIIFFILHLFSSPMLLSPIGLLLFWGSLGGLNKNYEK